MINKKNQKKSNTIVAMILMITVLISTISIYFNQNSEIFLSNSDLFDKYSEKNVIYLGINDIFWKSIGDIMKKGYSKDSYQWFENGPYPPEKEEFMNYLKEEIIRNLNPKLEELKKSIIYNLNYDKLNVTYSYNETGNKLFYELSGIYIEKNETNFYVKDDLKMKFDFSNQLYIFEQYKKWNKNEGVELLNIISNSFGAFCSNTCNCYNAPIISTNSDTGLNEDFILKQVDVQIKKLNTIYFKNSQISCDYEIIHKNISENIIIRYENAGTNSYCISTGNSSYGYTESTIWKDSPIVGIIDNTTYSYIHNPPVNFLERDLNIELNKINVVREENIPTYINNNPLTNLPENLNTVSLLHIKEPTISLTIDINCYDKQNFINNEEGNFVPISSKFGYRINIFKKCNSDVTKNLIYYNDFCLSDICMRYVGCKIGRLTCGLGHGDACGRCGTYGFNCSWIVEGIQARKNDFYCGDCPVINENEKKNIPNPSSGGGPFILPHPATGNGNGGGSTDNQPKPGDFGDSGGGTGDSLPDSQTPFIDKDTNSDVDLPKKT